MGEDEGNLEAKEIVKDGRIPKGSKNNTNLPRRKKEEEPMVDMSSDETGGDDDDDEEEARQRFLRARGLIGGWLGSYDIYGPA